MNSLAWDRIKELYATGNGDRVTRLIADMNAQIRAAQRCIAKAQTCEADEDRVVWVERARACLRGEVAP